jgi:hypothetical protein
MSNSGSYEKSVFINCPFDDAYWDLFRPLVFTVMRLGFMPKYSLERSDSSEARISKITSLIKESQFGIHDLSRCVAVKKGDIFRLNMPLELGLDMGAKTYGAAKLRKKKILILEKERYRFQRAISDLSNSDIKSHNADPDQIVTVVRDWLVQEANAPKLSPSFIWGQFNDCMADIYKDLLADNYTPKDIGRLPEYERIGRMSSWIKALARSS